MSFLRYLACEFRCMYRTTKCEIKCFLRSYWVLILLFAFVLTALHIYSNNGGVEHAYQLGVWTRELFSQ